MYMWIFECFQHSLSLTLFQASHPTLPQRSAMDAAIADIARGRSLRQSAAAHGVKKTTLFCRLRGQSSIKGRRRTLPSDLEDLLVERCKQVAEEGVAIKRGKETIARLQYKVRWL